MQKIIYTESSAMTASLFGSCDKYARKIEEKFCVRISNKGQNNDGYDEITVDAEEKKALDSAVAVIEYLKKMAGEDVSIEEQAFNYVIDMVSDGNGDMLVDFKDSVIAITMRGRPIKPKTAGQKRYIDAIRKNTIVFGIGPAGTGKTFLAVAMAVEALRSKQVNKIILTRPAVEAGERLGFLPGDLQSKIDPYLRPLTDALYEMLGAETYQRYIEKNTIEIAPLAYMRGRTLDDSFIILDEAQNTTSEQMKMFLTRLGYNSKAVVTGDPSQTDLLFGKKSGLSVALKILSDIEDIKIHRFSEVDVVRHKLVQKIIKAYDKYGQENGEENNGRYRVRREN